MPCIHQSQNKVLGNRVFVTSLFESLLHVPIVLLLLTLFILFLQRSYCLHTDSFYLKSGWNMPKFHTLSHIYKCWFTNNISDIMCRHVTIYHYTTYVTLSASCSLATNIQNYAKEKMYTVANLFYILQKYYPTKRCMFFQDTATLWYIISRPKSMWFLYPFHLTSL